MDDRALHDLKDLARLDADLADRAGRLRALDGDITALRVRAETIDTFFAIYPDEERRRGAALAAATEELERRRAELADAERDLEAARDEEERERAQSVVTRARDHVAVAEAARERAHAASLELERDASSLPEEVPLLEERARTYASAEPQLPRAPTGVRDLVEWASRAHAELFVAAGQLDAQRDRVIREANELATMLLGEPTYGSTVSQLAQRVLPLAGE